jgi:hypothetical protein
MRVVVYASPYYFTKDSLSWNGYEWNPCPTVNKPGNAVAIPFGENSNSYLAAVETLLKNYPGVDGIYFDEIYSLNLPESYAVIRKVRKLLGSDRRIIYHNTTGAVADPWLVDLWASLKMPVYAPAVEAYADFTASGESLGDQHAAFTQNYLRNRVSTYNRSNAVGLHIGYFPYVPASQVNETTGLVFAPNLDTGGDWLFDSLTWDTLRFNARMPYREAIHYNRDGTEKKPYESLVRYWSNEPKDRKHYEALLNSGAYFSQVFGRPQGQHFIGDFDGDHKADFVFFEPLVSIMKDSGSQTAWGSNSMYIRLTRSDRWDAVPGWQNGEFGHSAGQFFIGDFDGDSRSDFAFFEPADNSMHIRLNTAAGYVPGVGWGANAFGHSGGQFFIGDFDGDGQSDFAFFEPGDNSMHLFLNTGAGWTYQQAWGSNAFGHSAGQFFIGDFNGDGRSDFAFFEPADNSMYILLNTATGFIPGTGWGPNAFGHRDGQFFVGNFDGAGSDDFAFFEPADNSMHLFLNTAAGWTYQKAWSSNEFGDTQGRFFVGDFNGDKQSDFAFFRPEDNRIYLKLAIPDLNRNGQVDSDDIHLIRAAVRRHIPAYMYDPRDLNGDDAITEADVQQAVRYCTTPRCAKE